MEVIRDYDRVLLIELDVWVINCVHRLRVSGDSLTHTHTQALVFVTEEDVALIYINFPGESLTITIHMLNLKLNLNHKTSSKL